MVTPNYSTTDCDVVMIIKGVRCEWRSVKEPFNCFRATDVRFWPKLGKVWLDGPPFVAVPGLLPGAELAMGVGEQG